MVVESDFSTNVHRALEEIDPQYMSYDALVICGTHTPKDPERLISMIEQARIRRRPFLGICYGYQLAAVEYARTILNRMDAVSQEWGYGDYVVQKLPELKVGLRDGESYWQNYGVTIDFQVPEWFIVTPYHPEYQSRKSKPHKDLVKFMKICRSYS